MKKNLLYFFIALSTFSFFTACSDDDDPNSAKEWKPISETYQAESLILNDVSGKEGAIESVKLDAPSSEKATILLKNIIVGEPELSINVKLVQDKEDTFTLTGENSNDDRAINVQGTLEAGVLKLKTSLKVTSPVVGMWKLNIAQDDKLKALVADVMFDVDSDNPLAAILPQMVKPMLGQMIAQKVKSVSVNYAEDGKLAISFEAIGSDKAEMIQAIIAMLDLRYYVKTTDNHSQLFLALNKALLDSETVAGVIGAENLTAIKALLIDAGSHYALPINMKIDTDYAQFYVSKDLIGKVLPVVLPLIPNIGDYAEVIEMIKGIIPTAKVFDFGLGFKK